MDFDEIERAIESGQLAKDQHIRDAIQEEIVKESGVVVPSVLALLLGAFVFSQVGTMGAIAIALIAFEHIWKKLKRSNEMLRYYENEQFDRVLTPEIRTRYNLPPAPVVAALPAATNALELPNVPNGDPLAFGEMSSAPIGPNTQLGAINVNSAAIAVHADPVEQLAQDSRVTTASTEPINPAELLIREKHSSAHPCTASAILCAAPRGGKGSTVQRMIARVKALHPKAVVWAIDPKDDPEEYWYWEQCDRIYRCDAASPSFDGDAHSEGIGTFIREFYDIKAEIGILIIDECVTLKEKLPIWGWICSFVVSLSSSGPSRGKFAWALTQSPVNKDLGFTGGSKASMANLYLASDRSAEVRNHMASAFRSSFISSVASDSLLKRTGFTCHFNGKWYAVSKNDPVVAVLQNQMKAIASTPKQTATPAPAADESANTQKPNLSAKEIYRFAIELEEWVSQHPEVEAKDYYTKWNAKRKGFSRPEFRYLLTLIE